MKHAHSFLVPSYLVALAATVKASPFARADAAPAITDVQVLNFALTLEHLESAFYSQGLANYSAADFESAGFASWVRDRFVQVSQHEASHVAFLESALGSGATQACTYSFGITDVHSFVDTSYILEGVGTAAYTGAASFIQNKDYLKAAATILTVEGRHDAWVGAAVKQGSAWSTAYETPLDPNQVYTLASGFITSCPSSNPALPVSAFAPLTITVGKDATTSLEVASPAISAGSNGLYVGFLSGLNTTIVPLDASSKVTIPEGLLGTVYVVVSNSSTSVDDASTVAGPAILDLSFNSKGQDAPTKF